MTDPKAKPVSAVPDPSATAAPEPPAHEPPAHEPPAAKPLGAEPLGAEPLGAEPPAARPLGAELPAPEPLAPEQPEPLPPSSPSAPKYRGRVVAWLYGFGLLVLAGAIFYLYYNPTSLPPLADQSNALQALNERLDSLQTRFERLEQRAAPAAVDLTSVTARLDALEKQAGGDTGPLASRVSALEQQAGGDAGPLASRVTALEQRVGAEAGSLATRMAALEQKAGGDTQLAGRIDALAGRIDAFSAKQQGSDTEFTRRIEAEDARLTAMEKGVDARGAAIEKAAAQVSDLAERANRVARVQAAETALDAGQPLGEISGASPALARYATEPPPTIASLRLAYPAAERNALAVSSPQTEGKPFLDRVLARAQDLVTIRQGDRVVVGDESAGILARARTALNAGDLPGAVAAVGLLHGPPADAMADWLTQARALLAARSALVDMAARG